MSRVWSVEVIALSLRLALVLHLHRAANDNALSASA
jgi:hypothetical protein